MPIPKPLVDFGLQAAQGLVGGITGLAFAGANDRRQLRMERKLQDMQLAGQKQMTDYMYNKQLQMWKDTNYSAQMAELEKAGLNPGLLYGMSGGGGTTTGSGAGNVSRSTAPTGGGEAIAGMQTAAQLGLMRAQRENIEADTKLKETEAKKKAGVDTENIQADTKVKNFEANLKEIQASISRQTINEQMQAIENLAQKSTTEITKLQLENQLSLSTMNERIAIIRTQAVGALIENQLKQAQINKTEAEITKIANDITLGWEQLSNEQQKTRISQFTAEFQANHPGVMQVLGGAIQRLSDAISKPLKGNKIE